MALKIYVSSTFQDLEAYRESAYRALRALRFDVIAMEDYVAADDRPLDKCLKDVRECDVYVGLFAWRYGYVPAKGNPKKRSITELEYREAGKAKPPKPRLIFLLHDEAPWSPKLMDAGTGENEKGAKIEALRKLLLQERLASTFYTPDDLATKVMAAIIRWQTEASEAQSEEGPIQALESGQTVAARAGHKLLWVPGSKLRVKFLSGDSRLRSRVIRLAQIWGAYANISFVEDDAKDAEVRVNFKPELGSWAYEGANVLHVLPGQETMNLGWVRADMPIEDLEQVVLHEFGHVLGLGHEQNNPKRTVKWNKAAVYESMTGPPNYWSKEQIDQNLFSTWPANRFPFAKPFDPLSIMVYPYPAEFTGGTRVFGRNSAISAGDKEFVSRLYPYPAGSE